MERSDHQHSHDSPANRHAEEPNSEILDDRRPERDSNSDRAASIGTDRFADPAEAAADAQLSAPDSDGEKGFPGLRQRLGQSADDAADRMSEADIAEDPRVAAAIDRLRKIETLEPERWRTAESPDRQHAIREASRVLAESFGRPSPEVIFAGTGDKLELSRRTEGQWPGFDRTGQPYFIEVGERFLDKAREPEPREAVNTVCHEYRHVYQREALRDHTSHPATSPEEASWAKNLREGYVDYRKDFDAYEAQPVERDSRNFANEICRRLYD